MDYGTYIGIIAASTILFLAIILSIAIPPSHTKKILSWFAVFAVISALGMYGYGYGYLYVSGAVQNSVGVSILRTVFDSCRIFVGVNNWSTIEPAYADYPGWGVYFWVIHLLAMTTSASAMVVSLGSRLLKKLRMWLLRMRDITLIYGLSENTLEFGQELAQAGSSILYIDSTEQSRLSGAVDQMGAIFRSDPEALNGTVRFLRSIGLRSGKRKLHVYGLDNSTRSNQQFAKKLLTALEERGIRPEQTSLTILSVSDETDNPMQACAGRYGYGSLISINEPEMTARILIRSHPPYQVLTFDETGRATKDFHGVIIGFGQIGQAVLRQLVMNSQFQGCGSRIAVFAPDYEKRMGWLSHECRAMLEHYNISLFPYDGRSRQLYDYLEEHTNSINYVAICAGSEATNTEIGELLQSFLQRRSCEAPILLCSSRGVSHLSAGDHVVSQRIYSPDILCSDRIDRMAMVLNQSYQRQGSMKENWKNCSYFDRMSSRAAADFHDAILCAAETTKEAALKAWDPQGQLLENLAATEHLRWMAFHYCMGFRPMTEQEFEARAAEYRAAAPGSYRITKDMDKRIHGCMIPWEALDAYSRKENAVTGKAVDYAENDRNNIRDLAKVLRAMEQ